MSEASDLPKRDDAAAMLYDIVKGAGGANALSDLLVVEDKFLDECRAIVDVLVEIAKEEVQGLGVREVYRLVDQRFPAQSVTLHGTWLEELYRVVDQHYPATGVLNAVRDGILGALEVNDRKSRYVLSIRLATRGDGPHES